MEAEVKTKKYYRACSEAPQVVEIERAEPEPVYYKRGPVYVKLEGFWAGMYKAMIWAYGQDEATERFWWMFYKKEDTAACGEAAVSA